MSRMFLLPTNEGMKPMKTWNVWVGCRFNCVYCCARSQALTRLKHSPRYRDGFEPHFVKEELLKTFKPGNFVMVPFMGDISFATREEVKPILLRMLYFPETHFLFCSKNPGAFTKWGIYELPSNLYLGTTLESNRDYRVSKAPPPLLRVKDLAKIDWTKKFLSIEPIMDFDLEIFISWVHWLKPAIVEVGADNYHHHLKEPSSSKVASLLEHLRDICPTVVEKEGLERLKGIK